MNTMLPPRSAEHVDLWDLYECYLDEATQLKCETLSRFYNFLTSQGTRAIKLSNISIPHGRVDFKLYGPLTDDVNRYEAPDPTRLGCLWIAYRLYKVEVQDPDIGLTEEEQQILMGVVKEKAKRTQPNTLSLALGTHL